ncbi:DUF262 domain-containing protein [Puia dinghuensis]|nr:DUF262 domain-containing protein [Puia dinghuensis]
MADNRLLSLTEIFNQKFFRIPDFQRGYSWEETQLEDFWDDIINLKTGKVHYTGLLTVEPICRKDIERIEKWEDDLWLLEKGFSAYYIIDGQQRLTTSIIFINELLKCFEPDEGINFGTKEAWTSRFLYEKFGENYKSYIFGYEKDNPSDEYFKTKILEQKSSSSDKFPEVTLYTANLKFAKDYFESKFKDISNADREEIFKRVVNKLKFNFYEIDEELDIYITFETMNNRGKPLSNLELLKNRLIYLSTLLDDDVENRNRLRKDINETWKTIYEYLGKNKNNTLDDDEFLYNHWIMYFKYERGESQAYAKYLLHEKFTAQNIITKQLRFSEIKIYIDSLGECVKNWFYLFNPELSKYTDETKEWIQKLNRLRMRAFPPLLMAAMTKGTIELKLLNLFKAAEQFVFLVFELTQRPSNTKNNYFYRLANSYYFSFNGLNEEEIDTDYVVKEIEMMAQGEEGEGENYIYHGWFDLEKFFNHIRELSEKEEGYYSWSGLRYFLYEYELDLQRKANNNQKVSWVDFNKRKKEDTIEHIYPRTPNDECWKESFGDFDKKQRKHLLHSLGNLVLLAQSKNSELQNKCFEFKRRHLNAKGDEVGYFNGSYSEIEVASYNKWTANEIISRGKRMMGFMEERWRFSSSCTVEEWGITRDALLNVDFLLADKG